MWTANVCLPVGTHGAILSFISSQLDEILRDPTPPNYGEEHLAALTAAERTVWAEARQKYFHSGTNRASLEAIEKAAFVLVLDDEEFPIGSVSECQSLLDSNDKAASLLGYGQQVRLLRSLGIAW